MSKPDDRPYDFVAIGLSPLNLGLACLTAPIGELDGIFLHDKPDLDWHPGFLPEDAALPVPFLADLVSLADPTSPYSFLSYLKKSGRLSSFYLRRNLLPSRGEYVDYCRWAAAALGTVRFRRQVTAVEYDHVEDLYVVHADRLSDRLSDRHGDRLPGGGLPAVIGQETYRARRLVLDPGARPHLPDCARDLEGAAMHGCDYLRHRAALRRNRSITVVGGHQSAAEIFYDLLRDIDHYGYELTWATHSPDLLAPARTEPAPGTRPPGSPGSAHLPPSATGGGSRSESGSGSGYGSGTGSAASGPGPGGGGVEPGLVNDIFDLLDHANLQRRRNPRGRRPVRLLTGTTLHDVSYTPGTGSYTLALRRAEQDLALNTQGLVLATGYRPRVPAYLAPIADRIAWEDDGRFSVWWNFSIDKTCRAVYAQGAELLVPDFTAAALGMAAHRNSCIIRDLLGREYYPIEWPSGLQECEDHFETASPAWAMSM